MNNAIIYTRVSTDEQAEGSSLDAQEAKCFSYASTYDLNVVGVVRDEGQSAATLNRPGMNTLREQVLSGEVNSVIFSKLDRLSRSISDFHELLREFKESGVAIHAVNDKLDTSTASGMLVVNIMLSVAEWERGTIGERTRDALAHIKSVGGHIGPPPYGWKIVRGDKPGASLQPVPTKLLIARRARRYRAEGHTLEGIADKLYFDGTIPKRLKPMQIKRMLQSPTIDDMELQPDGSYRHRVV